MQSVIGGEYLISSPFKNINFSDVAMSSTDGYGVWAEFVNTHSKECGDINLTEIYLEYTKDRNTNSNSNDIVINTPSFEINNGIFDMTHEGDGFPCRRVLQCNSPINIKNQTIFLYGTLAVTCKDRLSISGNKDIEPYVDEKFQNNILLTQTERLTMNGRPANPKYARNKNVLVIGGSGSGDNAIMMIVQ